MVDADNPCSATLTPVQKIHALQDAHTYPSPPSEIEAIETHMSWVFLTERFAYKMKKPVAFEWLDFTTLEKREFFVREEVRLNRRLAPNTYMGAVPLTLDDRGRLRLSGPGKHVEWLVKMRRLPADRMLRHMIEHEDVDTEAIEAAARHLATFYAEARSTRLPAGEYSRRIRERIKRTHARLEGLGPWISVKKARQVQSRLTDFLAREESLLRQRQKENRIIEGHGDLRPDHVCLTSPPVIYDCLEFSRRLREVDAVYDLALLFLESKRLGNDTIAPIFWDVYAQVTGDDAPNRLISFYMSVCAFHRAQLTLRHLEDPIVTETERWVKRAHSYLEYSADVSRNFSRLGWWR